jgi:hypothetical protein
MKKPISTTQTFDNIRKVLELLAATPNQLTRLSQPLSDAQLHQPLGQGERSLTETLAHLLHCEARTTESITLALLADKPIFVELHAERQLGKLLRYDLLPFTELLAYFKVRRTVLLRVLTPLTEAQWSRYVVRAGKRNESVYWRARGQATHEAEHLEDLKHKLESQ